MPTAVPTLDVIDKENEVKLDRRSAVHDQIEASFKSGVLTVHLSKLPAAQHLARKIKVRAAV